MKVFNDLSNNDFIQLDKYHSELNNLAILLSSNFSSLSLEEITNYIDRINLNMDNMISIIEVEDNTYENSINTEIILNKPKVRKRVINGN